MSKGIRYSLCLLFLPCWVAASSMYYTAEDSIAPVIITEATGLTIDCDENTESAFGDWYNNAGGLEAEDDSGQFTIGQTLDFLDALDSLSMGTEGQCGNNVFLPIGFFALDECGNSSDTSIAIFATFDILKPEVITPAQDAEFNCVFGIQDSLENWLQNTAGAEASDLCGGVTWEDYIWNDSAGNNGFGKLSEPTNIEIDRSDCDWSVTVSFFVRDDCENLSVTTGQFSIIDTQAPIVDPVPVDLTVQCDAVPPLNSYRILDGCDGEIAGEILEISSQGDDPDSCDYYEYQISRKWVFVDNCGNMDSMFQAIMVIDTFAPEISFQNSISVSCTENLDDASIFFEVVSECSQVFIEYVDGTFSDNVCVDEFDRQWTITDVCGNSFQFDQNIQLQDNEDPLITGFPDDLILNCTDISQINDELAAWVDDLGMSMAIDACTEINAFAAMPGSYDINDPTSFPGEAIRLTFDNICEEVVEGVMYEQIADFIFFDGCGNAVSAQGMVRIIDEDEPVFVSCPEDVEVLLDSEECVEVLNFDVPSATDICSQYPSMVLDTASQLISSSSPGDASVLVDSIQFTFGPYADDLDQEELGEIQILFNNVDANSQEEFFIIEIEGTVVDSTPILSIECSDTLYTLALPDSSLWSSWMADNKIDILLRPFTPIQEVLGINDVCPGARVDMYAQLPTRKNLDLNYSYRINDGESNISSEGSNLILSFEPGVHSIQFLASDCAGNTGSCATFINITDGVPPEIVCPSDVSIFVDEDQCSADFILETDFIYSDNCLSPNITQGTSPETQEEALLQFNYDENADLFFANDVVFEVAVAPLEGRLYEPAVRLEYLADFSQGGSFELFSEDGTLLTSFGTNNSCEVQQTSNVTLASEDFENWISDGQVSFTLITNGNVLPCDTVRVDNTDGLSFARLTLTYQEIFPVYEITGDTTLQGVLSNINEPANFDLPVGNYNVVYQVEDNSSNMAVCEYGVTIIDNVNPEVNCIQAATVQIDPSGLLDFEADASVFVESFSDNCPGTSFSFEPEIFNCDDLGTEQLLQVTIEDASGNIDFCQTIVNIRPFDLELGFSSGLCIGDTLQLFSNIPEPPLDDAYQYSWTGPNNFVSNEEEPFIISPDASYSGTYVLEVMGFNGCFTSSSIEVLVEQLSDPVLETNNQNICKGETILLSTTSYTGLVEYFWYEGVPPSGILIEQTNTPVIEVDPVAGDHQYYVIVEGTECTSNASSVLEVSVVDKPDATVNDFFINVCQGESILFSSPDFDPDYNYQWIGPNGYMGSGQFPEGIEEADESNQGTYSLFVEDTGCLSDTTSFQVTVFAKPITPIINGESLICEEATFFLSVSNITNADQYIWFKDGVLFNTINGSNSIMVEDASSSLSGAWQVIAKEGNCESDLSESFTVNVEAQIPLGASNEGPVCIGDSVQLNATFVPDASYLWNSPNNESFSGQRPKVPAIEGEYSVTVTSSTGCTNEANTFVDVVEAPTITSVSNSAPDCVMGTTDIQFFATVFPPGSYTYEWTGPNNFSSDEESPIITAASTLDNGVYSLRVFSGSCPSEWVNTTVNMTGSPSEPIILDIGNVCEGDDFVLETNFSLQEDCAFRWQTPTGIVENQTGTLSIFNASSLNTGNYRVTVFKEGCSSASSQDYFVQVNAIPIPPIITGTDEVCEGGTILLEVLNEQGNLEWMGPDNFTNQVNIVEIPDAEQENEGLYTVTLEVNGCVSDPSAPFDVEILAHPDPPILPIVFDTVCMTVANEWEYCLDPTNIDSFDVVEVYMAIDDSFLTTIGPNGCFSFDLLANGAEDVGFYFISTKDDCISDQSSLINVHIFDDVSLVAEIVSDSIYLCDSVLFDLQAIVPSDEINIEWIGLQEEIQIKDSVSLFTDVTFSEKGVYNIVLLSRHNRCGLIGSDTLQVVYEDDIQANGDVIFMDLESTRELNIFANDVSVNAYTANLIFDGVTIESELNENGLIITTDNRFLGRDSIKYEICSNECPNICSQAVVIVSVGDEEDCFVSNVITPNGDGYNDTFEIPCLNTPLYENNQVIIFNQWGDEVFRAQPYVNDWAGEFNGSLLPSGTYFYVIDFNGEREPIQGFLILQE